MSKDVTLDNIDNEALVGHLILAGLDQRFEDQRALASECVARGMLRPGEQEKIEERLKRQAETSGLPRPIIAGPPD